jgi:nucleoid-associated protein YgaU
MGMFDFVSTVGRKIGEFTGVGTPAPSAAAQVAQAKQLAAAAQAAANAHEKVVLRDQAIAADIVAAVASLAIPIEGLKAEFKDGTVTLTGRAPTTADAEKAVLTAGNTDGVSKVDDRLTVGAPTRPSLQHTVVKGDTLSAIAARYYGVMRMFDAVFEANKPMLSHPDKIYPGQVLRIPPMDPPKHTVAKGETLGVIAKHWYGDAQKYKLIASANNLANPDAVAVGQLLTIPLVDAKV